MGQLSPWKHSAIRESIAIENETAFETMPTAQKQTANPADGLGFLGASVTDPLAQHKPVWEGLVPSLPGAGSALLQRASKEMGGADGCRTV